MNVIVCGGRDYQDGAVVSTTLEALHRQRPIHSLMQGGARGADRLAREWAMTHPEIIRFVCFADWGKLGNAAGPIRNKRMLDWKPSPFLAARGRLTWSSRRVRLMSRWSRSNNAGPGATGVRVMVIVAIVAFIVGAWFGAAVIACLALAKRADAIMEQEHEAEAHQR